MSGLVSAGTCVVFFDAAPFSEIEIDRPPDLAVLTVGRCTGAGAAGMSAVGGCAGSAAAD